MGPKKKNQESKKKTDINKAEVTPEKASELAKTKPTQKKKPPPKKKPHVGAQKVAKAIQKGHNRRRAAHVHTTVHFFRPKTLRLPRKPQYARRSVPIQNKLDHFRVIKHPVTTESAMKKKNRRYKYISISC